MVTQLILKEGRDASILRGHLWVFSGAVKKWIGKPSPGDWIEVRDSNGQFLAKAFYQEDSIVAKIVGYRADESLDELLMKRLKRCFAYRVSLGLPCAGNNIYRLIHAEGDALPGLIVDVYDQTAVMQLHAAAWNVYALKIAQWLCDFSEGKIKHVFLRSGARDQGSEGRWLIEGPDTLVQAHENEVLFEIDIAKGQKTGFFIDQSFNRALLGQYSLGKTVLNTFCYSGGFSLYALQNGATHVVSIDSSAPAMAMLERNLALNPRFDGQHEAICADVLPWLSQNERKFDLIVLDPPAFAKHLSARHKAIQAYRRINQMAMEKLNPGGMLFTFSCSQVVDKDLFRGAVLSAALGAGREMQMVHQLHQSADHPILLTHPEGEYLKGLVLRNADQ